MAMESCASAHHRGRCLQAMSHRVVLVPAQHCKPFVHGGKSDARDALAICEAAQAEPALAELYAEPVELGERQRKLEQCLVALSATYQGYAQLQSLPGVGPIVASALLAALGNARRFANCRQVAAWVGLVPRQYGTGGRLQLPCITKSGDGICAPSSSTVPVRRFAGRMARTRRWGTGLTAWSSGTVATRPSWRWRIRPCASPWVILARSEDYDVHKAFGSG